MKKITLLAIAVALVLSLLAYAGAQKSEFKQTDKCATANNGVHANANGFAIVNRTPEEDIEVAIQIQIRDAATNWTYAVYSHGELLGVFTTNKKGHGQWHLNLTEEPTWNVLGLNIWNQVKKDDGSDIHLLGTGI